MRSDACAMSAGQSIVPRLYLSRASRHPCGSKNIYFLLLRDRIASCKPITTGENRVHIIVPPPMDSAKTSRIKDEAPHVLFDLKHNWRFLVRSPIYFSFIQQIGKRINPLCLNIEAFGVAACFKAHAFYWKAIAPLAINPIVDGCDVPT